MRLARHLHERQTHLGVVKDDAVLPIDDAGFATMRDIVAAGSAGLEKVRMHIEGRKPVAGNQESGVR